MLVEGGGYEKIWLETQPMGGAMYATRNFTVGLNNSLLFMRHQRADGRIPGSIAVIDGAVVPQFNKFQGFCFPPLRWISTIWAARIPRISNS